MNNSAIPYNYETWHHCITVDCKIKLTADFISERIATLQDEKDFRTEQFVNLYGDVHLKNVISWFQQAKQEL